MDKQGNYHTCKALLDSGAQSNFLSPDFATKLHLPTENINREVCGVGSAFVTKRVNVTLSSLNSALTMPLHCLLLDSLPVYITSYNISNNKPLTTKLKQVNLADPDFSAGGSVHLVLGSGIFWTLLLPSRIYIGPSQPLLHETTLGWVVVSVTNDNAMHFNYFESANVIAGFAKLSTIEAKLEKFFNLEECVPSAESTEHECERFFTETTTIADDGKFVVRLPFKSDPSALGDSKRLALKRLFCLERKFTKNPKLKKMYTDFINEYKELGHMTKIDPLKDPAQSSYYIPHLGVLRDNRLTTKLRVVFDASAKTTTGVSLNDLLHVGPIIQDDLFTLLVRFRENSIAIAGDVTKMYRMVWIHQDDRKYQRILWRENPCDVIDTYELNTVTYGTRPASFLAIRCLHESANQVEAKSRPVGATSIKKDFYVDDYLSSDPTVDKARQKKSEVEEILIPHGYKLRKWASNCPDVFDTSEQSVEPLYLNPKEDVAVLGLEWLSTSDHFYFAGLTEKYVRKASYTKRTILSDSSSLFDPLGLVSPIIVRAKLILQKMWQLKLEWDETVPDPLYSEWSQLLEEIPTLQNLKVKRCLGLVNDNDEIIIHGFCDASMKAYGACIYFTSETRSTKTSNLICSKSRVAPLGSSKTRKTTQVKSITLPRLELCAMLLLAELLKKVLQALSQKLIKAYCWSDSTISLHWINKNPQCWETFVANRVAKIQKITNETGIIWNHVPSPDNPADIVSRGTSTEKLLKSNLWWHGPDWIMSDSSSWPKSPPRLPEHIPDTMPLKITLFMQVQVPLALLKTCSSFTKAARILAICLRYVLKLKQRIGPVKPKETKAMLFRRLKTKKKVPVDKLTSKEVDYAIKTLIKSAQSECFNEELQALSKIDGTLKGSSNLRTLCPFLDPDGLLRVGGRLTNAPLTQDRKHPLILPSEHRITELILQEEHLRLLHAPPNLLLAQVRRKFWPLRGRQLVKRTVRKCLTCAKARPMTINQVMAPLPPERVTPNQVFENVGIDNTGPILVRSSNRKSSEILKAYLCVFTCFATKANHLEIVTSLTTEAFISALKRFVSRRGVPQCIYSDNSKTFVGANSELQNAFNRAIKSYELSKYLCHNHIEWKFIPPRSPHFGGLWEASIRSFKSHFRKAVGKQKLTLEEAMTLSTQIEAVLNSRPITSLSSDPNDLEALTPGHFLIGKPLMSFPTKSTTSMATEKPLGKWKQSTKILSQFWKRWNTEYLQNLQTLPKWYKSKGSLAIGSLVALKDNKHPPLFWKFGRVQKLHLSRDGKPRVATLKTAHGQVVRAITGLSPLPSVD